MINRSNEKSVSIPSSTFFVHGNLLVVLNGSNLDFYNIDPDAMTLGSPTQSIPKPSSSF